MNRMDSDNDYSPRDEPCEDFCPFCEALPSEPHHPTCRLRAVDPTPAEAKANRIRRYLHEANCWRLVGDRVMATVAMRRAKREAA